MTENTAKTAFWTFRELVRWATRVGLAGKVAVGLAVCATLSGIATYVAFTNPSGDVPRATDLVVILLYLDLFLLLALGVLVARRMIQVWQDRRRGSAGSRLHIRLMVLFSLVALTPVVIVALFSGLVFNFGVQNWFSDRVRTALTQSQAVADSYLQEHRRNITGDIIGMANDLNQQGPALVGDRRAFSRVVEIQTQLRGLSEAVVFDGNGRVFGRSRLSFALAFERTPLEAMERARRGGIVYLSSEEDDRIRALIRLERFVDTFLMVGRFVDAKVLDHVQQTRSAVSSYKSLEQMRTDLEILFALIFVVVALLLLFVAIWVGLNFANTLAQPIAGLVAATERVRAGDLSARVPEQGVDELGTLSMAFNRMTSQLESQRAELVEANEQIDRRRRFIEAVLSGVSAGVIGLDDRGRINFPNQSASELLSTDLGEALGRPVFEFVPEVAELMERARRSTSQVVEANIQIFRHGRPRTLLVRLAVEGERNKARGFVLTFDDITELISAQRKAAWSDVARRLAHEIKNPLTPIQLAAERLKRRYLKEVTSDRETFSTCIDTIIRQVGDIGNMISEFSAFARMPSPVLRPHDVADMVRRAVFLQRSANADIAYAIDLPEQRIELSCDDRQVGQALTNLLQNAADSIARRPPEAESGGRISVEVFAEDGQLTIAVTDNGVGLPKDTDRDITDPYVTTRPDGTGLGLAIVQKIMEDHGGVLVLEDAEGGGARVSLVFQAEAAVGGTAGHPQAEKPEEHVK
jgi:two-component system nitrogen regulation sensor histidine kinase NtrY